MIIFLFYPICFQVDKKTEIHVSKLAEIQARKIPATGIKLYSLIYSVMTVLYLLKSKFIQMLCRNYLALFIFLHFIGHDNYNYQCENQTHRINKLANKVNSSHRKVSIILGIRTRGAADIWRSSPEFENLPAE